MLSQESFQLNHHTHFLNRIYYGTTFVNGHYVNVNMEVPLAFLAQFPLDVNFFVKPRTDQLTDKKTMQVDHITEEKLLADN